MLTAYHISSKLNLFVRLLYYVSALRSVSGVCKSYCMDAIKEGTIMIMQPDPYIPSHRSETGW